MEHITSTYGRESTTEFEYQPNKLIEDPVWGECKLGDRNGDEVLLAILDHDAALRLRDIEQLTFPENFATKPNTHNMSRYEHVTGSMVLVRQLWDKAKERYPDDFHDDDELLKLQLRTLLSDFGHTFGSHVGDMVFAGFDGKEDFHDDTLKGYLTRVGIGELLAQYNIHLDDVVFPEIQDWVECDSPKLCVDRVDYAMREIQRWVADDDPDFITDPLSKFELIKTSEGYELVVNDAQFAQKFARAYAVIAREHWASPAQSLQMKLYVDLIQHILPEQVHHPHPHDVMYGTEQTMKDLITRQIARGDIYTGTLVGLMERNASRSKMLWEDMKPSFTRFIEGELQRWPRGSDSLNMYPELDISQGNGVCVTLPAPRSKVRRIDPQVALPDGSYIYTSEFDKWLQDYNRSKPVEQILQIWVDDELPESPNLQRWQNALTRRRLGDTAVCRAMTRLVKQTAHGCEIERGILQ